MEDVYTEQPVKRRKIEETSTDNKSVTNKPLLNLQIKPTAIARLRQVANNIRNTSPVKNKGSTERKDTSTLTTTISPDKKQVQDVTVVTDFKSNHENNVTSTAGRNDVIISSAGSSPAHSPKPEDLTVLSTPPKQAKSASQCIVDKAVVSKKLIDTFDEPDTSGTLEETSGTIDESGLKDNRSVSSVKENSEKDTDDVVIVDEKEAGVATTDETKGLETPNTSASARTQFSFNSAELKKVLKMMIDEKFKHVESLYLNQAPESEFKARIIRLEDENRDLQEYAAKLEKAVTLLLNNQKSKKDKQSRGVQTDEMMKPRAASMKTVTPPAATKTQAQLNHVNKPAHSAVVTSRLTSTQASMPGHSTTMGSVPQRVPYTQHQVRATLPSPTAQTPTFSPQFHTQPPQYASNVSQMRTSAPQLPAPNPRRPAPVTVTVHPQTTPQSSTANMILSPSYSAQIQKTTYVTNALAGQHTQPPQQQFSPNTFPGQPVNPPIVLHQQAPMSRTHAAKPASIARPPLPPQQLVSTQRVTQQQYPNSVNMASPPNVRVHSNGPLSLHHVQGPVPNTTLTTQQRPQQNAAAAFQNNNTRGPPNITLVSPRDQPLINHNEAQNRISQDLPGKPTVSIAVVSNGIVLSWNMQNVLNATRIARYQLFALQDVGASHPPAQWKKIGVVNALPLPMACTLTQFMPGNKYHFTVRAQDENGRCGSLSEPCTITLK